MTNAWDNYWSRLEEDMENDDEDGAEEITNDDGTDSEPEELTQPIVQDPNDYWPRELEADLLADMEDDNDDE
jgi:hypothetical protein